ncbi:unnamed protein product [Tuber melanosporum]|uniref:(Perigord truffle) hypothetical protein n=1 Tax=Tuber melanosporum (strain Mel28) TaxID=656061 RepID=D5GKH0_TUBMM|nr:uncharacterized protein GSTUM_00009555001 [Tuber melanosporum]CAZ85013.1 unnamed protein product [Tuber melanosporum]
MGQVIQVRLWMELYDLCTKCRSRITAAACLAVVCSYCGYHMIHRRIVHVIVRMPLLSSFHRVR